MRKFNPVHLIYLALFPSGIFNHGHQIFSNKIQYVINESDLMACKFLLRSFDIIS